MTDGAALLKAILANPDDDTARLVYADYLQENGQEERAEFIRVQVELARGPEGHDCDRIEVVGKSIFVSWNTWLDLHQLPHGQPLVFRVRSLLGGSPGYWTVARGVHVASRSESPQILAIELRGGGVSGWKPELTNRERELWERRPINDACFHMEFFPNLSDCCRGFVESLTCTAADWLTHADAIRAAHPVREVTLTILDDHSIVQLGIASVNVLGWTLATHPGMDLESTLKALYPGITFHLPTPFASGTGGAATCGTSVTPVANWTITESR